jgi:hypothetical protein
MLGVNYGLPIDQIGKGQTRPTELLVKPDAEIMERNLGRQPCPETVEVMRPFPIQAEPLMKTAIDRFDDLAKTRQPAAPRARPGPLSDAWAHQ